MQHTYIFAFKCNKKIDDFFSKLIKNSMHRVFFCIGTQITIVLFVWHSKKPFSLKIANIISGTFLTYVFVFFADNLLHIALKKKNSLDIFCPDSLSAQ